MEEYSDAESKGVKAHFRMDESGIIRLESAEATFQKEVIEEPEKKEEKKDAPEFDKGTLDALKDKFKGRGFRIFPFLHCTENLNFGSNNFKSVIN